MQFSGDALRGPGANGGAVKPMLSASAGTIGLVKTFASRERKTFRVLFEMDFGSEALSELRLVLQANGKPASETWLFRWTA